MSTPLQSDAIERDLGTTRVGRNVICFGRVGSTNDVAFDAARTPAADGLVVTAEHQSRGRGRLGRQWISPEGANLLCSVVLLESAGLPPPEALTVAAGLAVAEGVEDGEGLWPRLKWPNDVTVNGAKVAGVLVEVRSGPAGRAAILGIGVNCHAAPPAGATVRPSAALADLLGRAVDRTALLRAILRRLDRWLALGDDDRADRLREAWARRCDMLNRRVRIRCDGREHTGRVESIDPLEGLALRGDDGQLIHLPAARSTVVEQ